MTKKGNGYTPVFFYADGSKTKANRIKGKERDDTMSHMGIGVHVEDLGVIDNAHGYIRCHAGAPSLYCLTETAKRWSQSTQLQPR